MGKLSYRQRKRLPAAAFAIPETREYPIEDINHARNALARVSASGSERERQRVRAAVYSRYPQLRPPIVTVAVEYTRGAKHARSNGARVMVRDRIPLRIRRMLGIRRS